MRTFLFAQFFLLFLTFSIGAQEIKIRPSFESHQAVKAGYASGIQTQALYKSLTHTQAGDKWAISVKSKSSRVHTHEELAIIKASKLDLKQRSIASVDSNEKATRAILPKIGVNFEANWSVETTPPDNTIAISNNGYIISANNDGIEYYSFTGQLLYFDFWFDFFNDSELGGTIFDPRVIYDSERDRFVLVLLHGASSFSSKVLLCFSKTNNPLHGWWIYKFDGNALNNNCWLDYPGLGVSNNEVYVTGNLFQGSSFQQPIIFQIEKNAGFNGESLNWQYWYNLSNDPIEAFTLVPASYGHQGNYGPGIYFVSSESIGDEKVVVWDLTDDMSGSPDLFQYVYSSAAYSPAADAYQSGSVDQLDNGDCRILDAFYLNGIVHYVHNTDIGDGWSGISYNRVSLTNSSVTSSTLGIKHQYDFAYPALASFSKQPEDPSVMIAFLRSSPNSFPECRVVNCDANMEWSPSVLVKNGETYIDFLSNNERWGDYTGMTRWHSTSEPIVWMAGSYGADIPSQSTFNTYKTWIAEIESGGAVHTKDLVHEIPVTVFPNPSYDLVQILFTTTVSEEIIIQLTTIDGHFIKQLYRDTPKVGENKLSFNKGMLSPGTYLITFHSKNGLLKNEKLVIAD